MTKLKALQILLKAKAAIAQAEVAVAEFRADPPGAISPLVFMDIEHSLDMATGGFEVIKRHLPNRQK